MTMGEGAVINFSWKQKINAKGSTEAELIAIDDGMTGVMWKRYF